MLFLHTLPNTAYDLFYTFLSLCYVSRMRKATFGKMNVKPDKFLIAKHTVLILLRTFY